MKRPQRDSDGLYHIKGKRFSLLVGSRRQVLNGTAYKTTYGKGGLKKDQLFLNKHGRIVSKKKHKTAKRENRLKKHGWTAKKGKFGAVAISGGRKTRRRRR